MHGVGGVGCDLLCDSKRRPGPLWVSEAYLCDTLTLGRGRPQFPHFSLGQSLWALSGLRDHPVLSRLLERGAAAWDPCVQE